MLYEENGGEYTVFTQKIRQPTDAYTARKVQKDRLKLKIWLNHILDTRDVIIFYKDNDRETSVVATRSYTDIENIDVPLVIETVGPNSYLVNHYILCFETPSRRPLAIHADSITKFICNNQGLTELSRNIVWSDHGKC